MDIAVVMWGGLALAGWVPLFWRRVFEEEPRPAWRWLLVWALKGLGAPALFWMILNLGIPGVCPPFMPEVDAARAAGAGWFDVYTAVISRGWAAIASYWAAMTFFWLAASFVLRFENWRTLLGVFLSWSLFLFPVTLLLLWWLGWAGLGLAGTVWFGAAAYNMLPLVPARNTAAHPRFGTLADLVAIKLPGAKPLPPDYSRAVAKMQFGKFSEAEWEVISELEKCEDDVEGWMMLAELYATHFHDLPAADQTIRDLCEQTNVTPSQVAVALHRLADWQLKEGADPVAARRALEEVCRRFPGSHLDKMARLRLQAIPATREELLAQRQVKTFHLPVLGTEAGRAVEAEPVPMNPEEARSRATELVEKLKVNPNDAPAREAFARLLAEQLGQTDLALEQMELLLRMGEPAPETAAGWLARMAEWQVRYKQDSGAAQELLERLSHQYPQTPQAFEAQARLTALRVEQRLQRARAKLSQAASILPADRSA